jgi:hypothetical protein
VAIRFIARLFIADVGLCCASGGLAASIVLSLQRAHFEPTVQPRDCMHWITASRSRLGARDTSALAHERPAHARIPIALELCRSLWV